MIKQKAVKLISNEYTFSVIAKIVGVVAGVVYSVLFSRYFQATLRGTASVLLTYSELGVLLLCFGIYQGYPFFRKKKEEGTYKEFIDITFGLLFLYVILLLIFVLFFRPKTDLIIISILIPVGIGIKNMNYVVMIENPKDRNISAILLSLFDICLVVSFMIFVDVNYTACVSLLLIKESFYFIIAIKRLRINIFSIRPTLKGSLRYVKFGILPMITVLMMEINYKADVVFLEWFKISKAEIGVYTLGVSLAQRIWMIPDALKDILLSKLAKGKTKEEVCKVTRMSIVIVLFFVVGMVALGKPFIHILYGDEYIDAYIVLLILLVGVVGMVFYKTVYSYNVIQGKRARNLLLLGSAAAINNILDVIMIPHSGMIGAAFSSTVSYFICGICFLFDFCRGTKTNVKDMILISKSDIDTIKTFLKNSEGIKG